MQIIRNNAAIVLILKSTRTGVDQMLKVSIIYDRDANGA